MLDGHDFQKGAHKLNLFQNQYQITKLFESFKIQFLEILKFSHVALGSESIQNLANMKRQINLKKYDL